MMFSINGLRELFSYVYETGGMWTYTLSKTAFETQFTNMYDKPRIAAAGAIGANAAVTKQTNWVILSSSGL